MDQQNFEAPRPVSADSPLDATPRHPGSVESLAKELGLKLGDQNELTIRRIKRGKSYSFVRANGTPVRHTGTIKRLHSMAVPPAYAEVRYAPDPNSHLQAVGRDAAGRLQYRYHSDWEKVREQRKAHRLARLVAALPKIRRNVSMHLSGDAPTREFALSAVIELIARTAIRPGNESYARLNGTHGATTLLKSHVVVEDDNVVLTFKAKGGKAVRKECDAAKLVRAIGILRGVPGKRMFQYLDNSGNAGAFPAMAGTLQSDHMVMLTDDSGGQMSRWAWYVLSPGKVRQMAEQSADGGKTWQITWDSVYVKK